MNKKKYKIIVSGCDAETNIEIELNDVEFMFIQNIAKKITDAAKYGCHPVMEIEEILKS